MKLSKALLQTIAVAVTVSAVSSCSKYKTLITPKDSGKPEVKPTEPTPFGPGFDCPACGMG